ncbi:hypothetical protein BV210_12795 [Halorientalis sp. IM1011]|uniref:hypothetical protein n=1 Tax=Halorientalis sp. IM1011 TaxID=1932360 RepID=UPI00097CC610|nr:hypothetical protein [Halorientalis sp. IM1011]AQL43518.1 hypothetical protein BV210_12795 [Halorientalis sp. IM1011]
MTLDVEVPDPPRLSGPGDPGDYDAVDEPEEWTGDEEAREALSDMLSAGAWEDAFEEWRRGTSLSVEQFRAARELGTFQHLDFHYNPTAEDVGYRAPSLPEGPDALAEAGLDRDDAREIEGELDDLGRIVSEVLENDYIHRSSEEFGYDWE